MTPSLPSLSFLRREPLRASALAALAMTTLAVGAGAAFAGGAPSGYEACATERQLLQQAQSGQATVSAGAAREYLEQCMKDHRYDGGEKRPMRDEHECRRSSSCS
jgi:hypothetical protein